MLVLSVYPMLSSPHGPSHAPPLNAPPHREICTHDDNHDMCRESPLISSAWYTYGYRTMS